MEVSVGGSSEAPIKRKRGRPRKNEPTGTSKPVVKRPRGRPKRINPKPKDPNKVPKKRARVKKEPPPLERVNLPLTKLQSVFETLVYGDEQDKPFTNKDHPKCSLSIVTLKENVDIYSRMLYSQRRMVLEARTCLLNQDWTNYYKVIEVMLSLTKVRFLVIEKLMLIAILYGPCDNRSEVFQSYIAHICGCSNESEISEKIKFVMQIRAISDKKSISEFVHSTLKKSWKNKQKTTDKIDFTAYEFSDAKTLVTEMSSRHKRRRSMVSFPFWGD